MHLQSIVHSKPLWIFFLNRSKNKSPTTLLSWWVFNYLDFRFSLKHWDSSIQRLYFWIYCGAHGHSSSAEWCYAIHMHIPYYQVKSMLSSMTSLFQVLVRNSEDAYSVLIEVGSTAVADCMQRILPNTNFDASTIQGQGLGISAPEPRSLLWWALNGSSFYSSNEICYKLQYERHHHH